MSWEEGEDDARSAWPSDTLGYTRDTIATTTGRKTVKGGANPYKSRASSDRGLQLDLLKPESLVIAGQLYCGEYVLKSCTRVAMRSSTLVGENPIKMIHSVLERNHSY